MRKHGPGGLRGPRSALRVWLSRDEASLDRSLRTLERHTREEAPIRWELVLRVRAQLANGSYLTEERWEAALDRLFDEME